MVLLNRTVLGLAPTFVVLANLPDCESVKPKYGKRQGLAQYCSVENISPRFSVSSRGSGPSGRGQKLTLTLRGSFRLWQA